MPTDPVEDSPSIPALRPGGDGARFCTTRWTMVLAAGGSGAERDVAVDGLCRAYWYPLYAYVRRFGGDAESARDAVQGFFEQMLERGWLAEVQRREARFSTLLLTIFKRFLSNVYRDASRIKRGGGRLPVSFDEAQAEAWYGAEPATDESPDRIFERRWALAVLDAALTRLREECGDSGRAPLFENLSPFLAREPLPGDYEAAGITLQMNARTVAVAVFRLRQQYRECVRGEVAGGLADASGVDEEMRHLGSLL